MNVKISSVKINQKATLENLLEKYLYEFSQYDCRPFNSKGLYGYEYLDSYWSEENRFAYFIYADDNLAGFALINKYFECAKKCDWAVAEFFIEYCYRQQGVATSAMLQIFNRHKGIWHIKYNCKNKISVRFWNKIAALTAKNKIEVFDSPKFYDKSKGKILVFEV